MTGARPDPGGPAPGAPASGAHHYVGLVRGINVGQNNLIGMAEFRAIFEGLGFSDVKTLLRSGNVVFSSARPLSLDDVTEIERAFEAAAGFRASFVVLSAPQFLEILAANPLLGVGTDLSRLVVTFVPLPLLGASATAPVTPAPAAAAPAAGALAADAPADALETTGTATSGGFTETLSASASASGPPPVRADGSVPSIASMRLPDADAILPEVFAAGPSAIYSWHPDGISNSRVPASFWRQLGPVYTARNVNTANKLAALLRAHP